MSATGVTIRPLTAADLAALDEVLMRAFKTDESYRPDLSRFLRIEPDGWIQAERAGSPVGMVGAVSYGPFAYVGMMAVDPAHQGQGIGRALMETLLERLDRAGCPQVLLDASAMGAVLYEKLGFGDEGRTAVFAQAEDVSLGASSSLDEGIAPLEPQDLAAVEAFDSPYFGAPRGRVLSELVRAFPQRAFVARDAAGEIEGFLIAQPRRIGPWMARSPRAAEGLLRVALRLPFGGLPRVLLPEGNQEATGLLARYGFQLTRANRHMRRGSGAHPGQLGEIYGRASFAIG